MKSFASYVLANGVSGRPTSHGLNMVIAYFDCASGVAGDMVLGALIDAGMPLAHLKGCLRSLKIGSYEIAIAKSVRRMRGVNLSVAVASEPRADDYRSLDSLIARSRLKAPVKEMARAIFLKLARAEAKVHRVPLAKVHFHEVGAVDSVVDVVGAAIGFEHFGFEAIHSSPLPMSRGIVGCSHGTFASPAPAALEIMKGIPLDPSPARGEIVTPTGAAIIATAASHFGECPIQRIENVGHGFGDREIPGIPNALRLIVGEGFPAVVIECDIDDMNPQLFERAAERLAAAGAVDVSLTPIQMKKMRPGVRLRAIAPWAKKDAAIEAILKETTTFGVRYWPAERKVLVREMAWKRMRGGKVRFKLGLDPRGRAVKAVPEYEDVKRIAVRTDRPIASVYAEAMAEAAKIVGRRMWDVAPYVLRPTAYGSPAHRQRHYRLGRMEAVLGLVVDD